MAVVYRFVQAPDGSLVAPSQSAPLTLPTGTHILRITKGGKTVDSGIMAGQ